MYLALGASCSTTKVERTWIDPDVSMAPIDDVLVVAVVRQEELRRSLEDEMAGELRRKGVAAVPSHRLLQGEALTRDAVREVVGREGFDHVLVTNYRGLETELDYVPPTTGYYGYMGMTMASPGYYRETTVLTLQTRLFSAEEGGRLLWSANSRTTDPSTSREAIAGVAKELVEELGEDVAI
jgi:hypothetical protein